MRIKLQEEKYLRHMWIFFLSRLRSDGAIPIPVAIPNQWWEILPVGTNTQEAHGQKLYCSEDDRMLWASDAVDDYV